jgi:hypothetical protein
MTLLESTFQVAHVSGAPDLRREDEGGAHKARQANPSECRVRQRRAGTVAGCEPSEGRAQFQRISRVYGGHPWMSFPVALSLAIPLRGQLLRPRHRRQTPR